MKPSGAQCGTAPVVQHWNPGGQALAPQHRNPRGAQKFGAAVLQHCVPIPQAESPQHVDVLAAQKGALAGELVVQHCWPPAQPGLHCALAMPVSKAMTADVTATPATPPKAIFIAFRREKVPPSMRDIASNRSPLPTRASCFRPGSSALTTTALMTCGAQGDDLVDALSNVAGDRTVFVDQKRNWCCKDPVLSGEFPSIL
jgi:hypothetical protein